VFRFSINEPNPASKALGKSGTAIGIRCIDGVVLACEKSLISNMIVPSSNRCIHTLNLHAGISSDARQLVNKAYSEASEYHSFYDSEIPPVRFLQTD
jgi:20S proteasome subunit alpha 7